MDEHSTIFWLKIAQALLILGWVRIETGFALVALGGDPAVAELQGGKNKRVRPSGLELLLLAWFR